MGLADWFNRWRHTKGYGVHSPLAFRIVKHVMKPRRDVVYYGEEQLQASAPGNHGEAGDCRNLRRARILLRLVAELQPSYVWVSPGIPDIYKEAVMLAGCVIRIYDGELFPDEVAKADMIVLYDYNLRKPVWRKIMAPGKSVVAFNVKPGIPEWIREIMKGGVLLEGKESILAVNTRDEAVHCYNISKF